MKAPIITSLPYQVNNSDLFAKLHDLPYAVFLDSCYPYSKLSRYDIISALPHTIIATFGNCTIIKNKNNIVSSALDPFHLLQRYLGNPVTHATELPFFAGAIGYFGYDLGRHIEKIPNSATNLSAIPDMLIGLYDWAIVTDHQQQKTWLTQYHLDNDTPTIIEHIKKRLSVNVPAILTPFTLLEPMQSSITKQQYQQAFNKVLAHIQQGDCYQVNLSHRLSAKATGSAWQVYSSLRQNSPAPYAAYINAPDFTIMSLSPERFLQINNGIINTKPIKGTRPRHSDPVLDQQALQQLANSTKDQAENLMIVDLLRNDLSKSCQTNSLAVPQLFAIESFSSVHHMVSTITAQLAQDKQVTDVLRGCFPGGSITGAPKIRAMEIIESLEPQRRNIYCGSIGYIGVDGNMDTNIAIRTLLYEQQQISCSAGGGLVADSNCEEEYLETFAKIRNILETLETFRI